MTVSLSAGIAGLDATSHHAAGASVGRPAGAHAAPFRPTLLVRRLRRKTGRGRHVRDGRVDAHPVRPGG